MSGSPFLILDTNVVLHYLGGRLPNPLEKKQYIISIVTEIELLSYPSIQAVQEYLRFRSVMFLTYCPGEMPMNHFNIIQLR